MKTTLKYGMPRGLEADTEFYGFYCRAKGETRDLLRKVHTELSERYGAPVTNDLLLRDVLRSFVDNAGSFSK